MSPAGGCRPQRNHLTVSLLLFLRGSLLGGWLLLRRHSNHLLPTRSVESKKRAGSSYYFFFAGFFAAFFAAGFLVAISVTSFLSRLPNTLLEQRQLGISRPRPFDCSLDELLGVLDRALHLVP